MADNTRTLSERIDVLLDAADQLRVEIRKLAKEVNRSDGIESIDYLADVPGELDQAEQFMGDVCKFLDSATTLAKKGGY